MNKNLIILFVIVTCGCNLNSSQSANKSSVDVQSTQHRFTEIDSLILYYEKSKENKENKQDLKKYNRLFPHSFKEFVSYFGFDEILGEKPLYNHSEDYIDLFFNQPDDKSYRYKKMILIAKDGSWEADAPNYFKYNLQSKLKDSLFIEILLKQSFDDQVGFWHFYFDNPHSLDKIPKDILEKFKGQNKMLLAIRQGFELTKGDK